MIKTVNASLRDETERVTRLWEKMAPQYDRQMRQIAANTTEPAAPKSRRGIRTIHLLPPVREALLDLPQRGMLVFPGARGGLWITTTSCAGYGSPQPGRRD